MYSEDELYHHGVKGMKWGIRKARQKISDLRNKRYRKKKQKLDKLQAKLDKKSKITKEEFEKAKQKAINSGSAEEVLKFKGHLSNQELKTVSDRLRLESEIAARQEPHVSTGKKFIDKTLSTMETTNQALDKGVKLWNNGAKIANAFLDYELPVIDGTSKSQQKAKKLSEQEKARMNRIAEYGNIDEVIKNMEKMSAAQVKLAEERLANQQKIRNHKNVNRKNGNNS